MYEKLTKQCSNSRLTLVLWSYGRESKWYFPLQISFIYGVLKRNNCLGFLKNACKQSGGLLSKIVPFASYDHVH